MISKMLVAFPVILPSQSYMGINLNSTLQMVSKYKVLYSVQQRYLK